MDGMPEHDEPETPAPPAPGDDPGAADAEALVRKVTRRPSRRVDPEDWASSGGDDDDRYLRDRPPHWQ